MVNLVSHRVSLEEANDFCNQHSKDQPSCEYCASVGHFQFPKASPASLIADHGWEADVDRAGHILRCKVCRDAYLHPWIAGADRERVRDWMQGQSDKHWGSPYLIDWDDLQRAVGRTFVFSALAGYVCGAMAACALNTSPTFHAPTGGVVEVIDDDCDAPCCTRDFDSGDAADHEGCR